jgi:hypothetical protein
MHDDDIIPSDSGAYPDYQPEEPQERKQAEREATSAIATSYPIMDDVKQWFTDSIIDFDSIDSIQMEAITVNGVLYDRKVSIEAQLLAQKLCKQKFIDKAQAWGDFEPEERL